MAENKKVSELDAASALTGDELLHVVQGGNSRQTTVAEVAAHGTVDTFSDLANLTDSDVGDGEYVVVRQGFNGEPETFTYDDDSVLTADGALVVDAAGMSGGRFISTRTVYADFDEFIGDERTFTNGTAATIQGIAATYTATGGTGSLGQTNAGNQEWDVWTATGDIRAWGASTSASATSNTTAIQAALDNAPIGSTVTIPDGQFPVTGSGTYVLTLTRNVNIRGEGSRTSLRADSVPASTSLLGIAITENSGSGDVRNWSMEGVRLFFNGGGEHAVEIYGGLNIMTSAIRNCTLSPNLSNGGYSFYVSDDTNWQHSLFELNTCSGPIYALCGDANLFTKNIVFASSNGPSFTFDLQEGVRNNTVESNTLVSRDGALHVINGNEVRLVNNQIEQFSSYGANTSTPSASVYLEGADREVTGCVIEKNNFGGGVYVDYSIYIDNAQHTVITKNNFVACDIDEVYCTSNSKYNIWEFDNQVFSTVSNTRTGDYFKANLTDMSLGYNIQFPRVLGGQNSYPDMTVYKRKDGVIVFMTQITTGSTGDGTLAYTLPAGMRGYGTIETLAAPNNLGDMVVFRITNTNGQMSLEKASTGSANITIPPVYRTPISTTDY